MSKDSTTVSTTHSPIQQHVLDFIKHTPHTPGVYKMLDFNNNIIYIGKAKNLHKRLTNYTNFNNLNTKTQRMVAQINAIEIIETKNELDALFLESQLIKEFQPKYNVLLKDDKSFSYIFLSNHKFPRIFKYRGIKRELSSVGPFISSGHAYDILENLCKIFLLRTCKDSEFNTKKRPCLRYYIKRCSAPCCNKITTEDYQRSILEVKKIFIGENNAIIKKLKNEMLAASKLENFEQAAKLRDKMLAVENIKLFKINKLDEKIDIDVFAIASKSQLACLHVASFEQGVACGESEYFVQNISDDAQALSTAIIQFFDDKTPRDFILTGIHLPEFQNIQDVLYKKWGKTVKIIQPTKKNLQSLFENVQNNAQHNLEERITQFDFTSLGKFLNIQNLTVIDILDNSHLFGTNAFAGIVRATETGFDQTAYRAYKCESKKFGGDDYEFLKVSLSNRINDKTISLPNLFIIDGGAAHISLAQKILNHTNIPILSISKGPDRKTETFFTSKTQIISIDEKENANIKFLLLRLRDEAHRFIISTHRYARNRTVISSELDNIIGISTVRKIKLLEKFKNIENIANSSIEQLQEIGLSAHQSQLIKNYFLTKN